MLDAKFALEEFSGCGLYVALVIEFSAYVIESETINFCFCMSNPMLFTDISS